ncbi:uroporphyrinogen-III synthase [Daktulosphaira vitifoliae]|uniref:uroporphyrinogen-III synthase n=1 Tax=Daktulosphaira vitifoliae TaxID=58002 RepID=UPI0021AA7909|nr:uroporphyrinogen-III synthase [Daktulosphaira vitifoliae]
MAVKYSFIILKAQSEENESLDPYIDLLQKKGYEVHFVPTLQFEYHNLDVLKKKLNQPMNYSGLVLTSPRCLRGVMKSLKNDKLDENWHQKPIFVVGETTSRLVVNELNQEPVGAYSGNAMSLIPILSKYELTKPLLAPCGNLNLNILSDNLKSIKLENVEVYRTISHSNLENNLRTTLDQIHNEIGLIFFSPSGFQASIKLIPENYLKKIVLFSIGPTTASAIKQAGYILSGICDKPKPESMLDMIDNYMKCQVL